MMDIDMDDEKDTSVKPNTNNKTYYNKIIGNNSVSDVETRMKMMMFRSLANITITTTIIIIIIIIIIIMTR